MERQLDTAHDQTISLDIRWTSWLIIQINSSLDTFMFSYKNNNNMFYEILSTGQDTAMRALG